jgi:hypothetical protein
VIEDQESHPDGADLHPAALAALLAVIVVPVILAVYVIAVLP